MSRNKIAVFGLLAVAVLTIFNLLLDVPHSEFSDINLFDSGVAVARSALPASGKIGFFTDAPAGANAQQEYYLTQYSLAPLVVANDTGQDLVIASIRTAQSRPPNPRLSLARDFKNGIKLFRARTQ